MQTSRLSIRLIKYPLDDQPYWLNDPRNTKYSSQKHRVHDKTSCAEYIRGCSHFWGIQRVDDGEWIGTMASHLDDDNNVANLGILIHHEFARHGYGYEAWEAACDYLIKQAKVRKIEAGMVAHNEPMKKLCARSKMFFDGERKNQVMLEGNPVSVVYYAKWA